MTDLLLDALAVRLTDGYCGGGAAADRAIQAFCDEALPVQDALRWLSLASVVAWDLWDYERWHVIVTRSGDDHSARPARSASSPMRWTHRGYVHLFAGELAAAASVIEEASAVSEATGTSRRASGPLGLAALRGQRARGPARCSTP